jgi:hypothetical protein
MYLFSQRDLVQLSIKHMKRIVAETLVRERKHAVTGLFIPNFQLATAFREVRSNIVSKDTLAVLKQHYDTKGDVSLSVVDGGIIIKKISKEN